MRIKCSVPSNRSYRDRSVGSLRFLSTQSPAPAQGPCVGWDVRGRGWVGSVSPVGSKRQMLPRHIGPWGAAGQGALHLWGGPWTNPSTGPLSLGGWYRRRVASDPQATWESQSSFRWRWDSAPGLALPPPGWVTLGQSLFLCGLQDALGVRLLIPLTSPSVGGRSVDTMDENCLRGRRVLFIMLIDARSGFLCSGFTLVKRFLPL